MNAFVKPGVLGNLFDIIFSVIESFDCANTCLKVFKRLVVPLFDENQQIVSRLLNFVTLIIIVAEVIASRAS